MSVSMTPDDAWIVGSSLTALIATGPAYLAAKRGAQKTGHTDPEVAKAAVVDALQAVVGPLNGRLDEMHQTLNDISKWQSEHATDHAISALTRSPILEIRKGE